MSVTGRCILPLLASLAVLVECQLPQFWSCPDHPVVQNFDISRYAGTWYEQERAFTWSEAGTRCISATYTPLPDGRINVANEQVNRVTSVKRVISGEIKFAGRAGEGKLSVSYPTVFLPYETTYSILDTDYDSYSVIWSCFNMGIANMQNVWVMTRQRLAPNIVLQRAYGILDKLKIPHNYLVKTLQDDCDLIPDNSSAVFGQEQPQSSGSAPNNGPKSAGPDAKPAPQPAAEPAPQPAAQPVPQPAAEAAPQPAAQPIPLPAAEPPKAPQKEEPQQASTIPEASKP